MDAISLLTEARSMSRAGRVRPVVPRLLQDIFVNYRPEHGAANIELRQQLMHMKVLPAVSDESEGVIMTGATNEGAIVPTPRFKASIPTSAKHLLYLADGKSQVALKPNESNVEQRVNDALAVDLDILNDSFMLTEEIILSQLLRNGVVDMQCADENGKLYKYVADFKRPASHTVTLTDTELVSAAGAMPVAMIKKLSKRILDACGLHVDTVIHGSDCWDAFHQNEEVKDHLNTRRLEGSKLHFSNQKAYEGSIGGVDHFSYGGSYPDVFENMHEVFPAGGMLLGCSVAPCFIEYGLPCDLRNQTPIQRFYNTEIKNNRLVVQGESRPLPTTNTRAFLYIPQAVR